MNSLAKSVPISKLLMTTGKRCHLSTLASFFPHNQLSRITQHELNRFPLSCVAITNERRFGTCCHCGIPQRQTHKTKGMRMKKSTLSCSSFPVPSSLFTPSAVNISSSMWHANMSSGVGVDTSSDKGGQWDIVAGIVVERKPVITQKMDAFQEKYSNMLTKIEFEMSKKSDHEIRKQNDETMLEKVKAGEIDVGNVQTARDDEDKWAAEKQSFKPASRETDADVKNDTKSLERALDSHLLLLVEQKLGNEFKWICPHSKLQQGETLRQAAERMMRETFPEMKMKVLGHAPWGFYKYKYPLSNQSNDAIGAKVFFYKAQVVSGSPSVNDSKSDIKDFVWLKREELSDKLHPEYYEKLSNCLIDEF